MFADHWPPGRSEEGEVVHSWQVTEAVYVEGGRKKEGKGERLSGEMKGVKDALRKSPERGDP